MNYWQEREAKTREKITDKNIMEVEAQLKKYYASTTKKIIGQFEETYNKVLLSISEDRKPTTADLYKLDKYWQMQKQLQKELDKLGDKEIKLLTKRFEEQYKNIYEAIAFKDESGAFNKADPAMASKVADEIWCADGKSWSQRVWKNNSKLQEALNENLVDIVVSGKNPSELKKLLMAQFNVSFRRADSIVRTELARIETEASRDRYVSYGIEQVEVLVEPTACPVCQKFKGHKYPIYGKMPVPCHPRCRCCIVPVIED